MSENIVEWKTLVREHIERCMENYGNPLDDDWQKPMDRSVHEQMRADLMLAIGMLSALCEYQVSR